MDIYYVYWIHLPNQFDVCTEGYVGVSKNPKRRLTEHKRYAKSGYEDNPYLGRILQKYNNSLIQTIIFCGTRLECYQQEEILRPEKNIGWNINKGGDCPPLMNGIPRSEETKKKISASLKGHAHSEETKKKISEKNKGRVCSEETKLKLSNIFSGKPRSDEVKQKISNSQKGIKRKPLSIETKEKISKTLKNRQFSEETKNKISAAKKEYWASKKS